MRYQLIKSEMNKKGVAPIALVMAIFLGIILLIFLTGGGISTLFSISKFVKSIPTFIWVILGIVILFKLIGGKKRK